MYAVEIKPSARRINRPAGEYLARHGPIRRFDSKREAREWAAGISDGDGAVRVQDAAPNDPADVDGYLVADPVRARSSGSRRRGRASRPETTLGEFG